jgi:hypothetical protein
MAKGLKLQRSLGDVFGAMKQSSKDSRVSSPLYQATQEEH